MSLPRTTMSSPNRSDESRESSPRVRYGGDSQPVDNDRREILRTLAGTLGVISIVGVVPVIGGCEISRVNNAGGGDLAVDTSSLVQDNDALVTKDNGPDGAPILVVRVAADTFRALSMRCTHLGCTVGAPSGDRLVCPCHGSVYALDGSVISSPATQALHLYQSTYDPISKILIVHLS